MADKPLDVESIFHEARQIKDPTKRKAYLDGVCGNDQTLRSRLEKLLSAEAEAGHFLGTDAKSPRNLEATRPSQGCEPVPLVSGDMTDLAASATAVGTVIGPYKLLEVIGEGGFGTVFMAEQEKPVRRRVALKIIKLGMDTRQVIARFEQERQALAIMDHPNIARVLDAGATDTGRPYFVMELVKGAPITAYCDAHHLSAQDRLELFISVCQAVQHAHQKGIIHRDIKPSNVLVSRHDDEPVVKVIDFGIAKATGGRLTEKTMFTEFRQMIGTPAYMSPEQAGLSDLDIDTRTDVYSLGVLLYELLTGSTPFDIKTLLSAGYAEIQRIIREVEPPTPSTRLSTMKEELSSVAARRKTEPGRLTKLVRGDLDWIVMKALEKDRSRRYDTANGLAADVLRYLSGEPVVAAPPSALYRLQKFIKRNKGPVIAAGMVAAALVLGIIGTTVGFVHAQRQRDVATRARDEAVSARRAEEEARQESDAINQFIQTALKSSDPNQGGKQEMLVADAMSQAVKLLDDGAFKIQPIIDIRLRMTIADILRKNNRSREAVAIVDQAHQLARRLRTGDDPLIAETTASLARALMSAGRSDVAETHQREALAMSRRLNPGDHERTARILNGLAGSLANQERYPEAAILFREEVDMWKRIVPHDSRERAEAINDLGFALQSTGKISEAEPLYREALAMRRRMFTGDHPDVAESIGNVAWALQNLNRPSEAEPFYREAMEMYQRMFKADHQWVARSQWAEADCLMGLGRLAEALPLFQSACDMRRRLSHDQDHFEYAQSMLALGNCLLRLGRREEAMHWLRKTMEMRKRLPPSRNINWAYTLQLAGAAMIQGSLDDARLGEQMLRESLETRRRAEPGSLISADCQSALGGMMVRTVELNADAGVADRLTRLREAETLLSEGYEQLTARQSEIPESYRERVLNAASERLMKLYLVWDTLEPGTGKAEKAARWKSKPPTTKRSSSGG